MLENNNHPACDRVFMANSAYSLFCYLVMFPTKIEQTLFLRGPAIQHVNLPMCFDFVPPQNETPLEEKLKTKSDLRKAVVKYTDKPVYYLNLTTPYSDVFLDEGNVHALSDGLSDYERFKNYYQDDRITECFSTAEIIKDLTDKKLSQIDVNALWSNLPQAEQNKIADIFNISTETLNKASTKKVMLITQPLSEDQMMSEEDKVELYKRIVDEYGVENIVIKPHPREKTNWANIFPDAPVIPKQIPVELLARLANIKRIATFFSTAGFGTIPDEKIDFYALDFGDLKAFHPDRERTGKYKSVANFDIEEIYCLAKNCVWKRIPDKDNRFYHDRLELDSAGIPTHISKKNNSAVVLNKKLYQRQS